MEKKLKPHWGGVVAVVAFLYGLWAASSIYTGTGSHEGPGIIGIYILMSIIFFTVMMITVFPVGWALILLKHDFLRLCFVLIALGIFLVGYGIPSFVVISIAFWINMMATKITPSKEYLQKFTSPLWDALDLEDCTPLMIVEGKQGTFPYMVIKMQHRAYGILSRNGATAVSTFFIVTLPDASAKQRITWYPPARRVSTSLYSSSLSDTYFR